MTAVVLLLIKGTLAYWPSDRDSRALAMALQQQAGTLAVDEFIFVNMRPLYGLNVYLPQRVDGLELDSRRYDYSTHVTRQTLCADLARRPPTLYMLKTAHLPAFADASRDAGARRIGSARCTPTTTTWSCCRPGPQRRATDSGYDARLLGPRLAGPDSLAKGGGDAHELDAGPYGRCTGIPAAGAGRRRRRTPTSRGPSPRSSACSRPSPW